MPAVPGAWSVRASSPWRLLRLAPLLTLLSACSTLPQGQAQEGRLYGEVYRDVARYHLERTSAEELALTSLGALHGIDPALSVSEDAGIVALRSAAGTKEFPAPPPGDTDGWGELAARVLGAARGASPGVAALAPDRLDERLMDAALARLDPYSRYVAPETAVLRRAERDGSVGLGASSVTLEEGATAAVLTVRAFNGATSGAAARALAAAHRDMGGRLGGIVLDLRGNPGGLIDQAVAVASLFLDRGPVLESVGRAAQSREDYAARSEGRVERLPLVVVIDGGSMSAAEALAAALQDRGRAVVIGTASFGKGTAQLPIRTGNGGELKVTWAALRAPGGYALDRHGVVPTLCTPLLSGEQEGAAAPSIAADLAADPLTAPRARLDEAGWRALRDRCPPRRDAGALDLVLARRLLAEPHLYRSALLPQPTRSVEGGAPARSGG